MGNPSLLDHTAYHLVMTAQLVDQVLPAGGQKKWEEHNSSHTLPGIVPAPHLGVLSRSMSPHLPTSSEPWLSDMPRAAAALIVAAARASDMFMCRFTQARCMTRGYGREAEENEEQILMRYFVPLCLPLTCSKHWG